MRNADCAQLTKSFLQQKRGVAKIGRREVSGRTKTEESGRVYYTGLGGGTVNTTVDQAGFKGLFEPFETGNEHRAEAGDVDHSASGRDGLRRLAWRRWKRGLYVRSRGGRRDFR